MFDAICFCFIDKNDKNSNFVDKNSKRKQTMTTTQDKLNAYFGEYRTRSITDLTYAQDEHVRFSKLDAWIVRNMDASVTEFAKRADYVTSKIMSEGTDDDRQFMKNQIRVPEHAVNSSAYANAARVCEGDEEMFKPYREHLKQYGITC